MTARTSAVGEDRPGQLVLWTGMLGPPVVWTVRLAASYILVPFACAYGGPLLLHLVTVAALLITIGLGWMSWRNWRTTGNDAPADRDGTLARIRFMALFGVMSAAFFFLVMTAEGSANLFLDPCHTAGAPLP